MTDNKHPHHDLIVEWLKDTNKIIQVSIVCAWSTTSIEDVINNDGGREYRLKPREFVKGHWYPCLCKGCVSVCMWNGSIMVVDSDDEEGYLHTCFDKIGESLGKVEF